MDREFRCGARRIGRRAALELGLCLALAPRLALAQTDAADERPREGDVLVAVGATPPVPLKPEDLKLDAEQTIAWPMDPATSTVRNGSRLNEVLLLRLDPEGFDPETKEHAADGIVAYSAICVHAGCEVSDWDAKRQVLECPCHGSIYDPKKDGEVVSGPAPRNLPALPLKVVEGRLVVAKPFTSRPGFEQA